jgi:hypothetical protein
LREDYERHREAEIFDGWLNSLSADTKDAEYSHTVYECKNYFTVTGAFFVGAAAPY